MGNDQAISDADLMEVGLIYVEEQKPGITRVKCGRGFSFRRVNGKVVKDPKRRARLLALAVPPSYTDVWYCPSPNGHLQATGFDSKGKKQYFYHPLWEELRDRNKFSLMEDFGKELPSFRRKIAYRIKHSEDGKEKLLCAMLRILDKTGMRIGNAVSTETNQTYGLTTLRKQHISVDRETVHFSFKGKGGVLIKCELYDPGLARALEECIHWRGVHIFAFRDAAGRRHQIRSEDINNFIHEHMGPAFSAKDFRTWRFSTLFLEELVRQRKRGDPSLKSVFEEIVAHTCNTPAILKSSYIHPGLLELCRQGKEARLPDSPAPTRGLQKAEALLLAYLQSAGANTTLF
ncbi:DNA topoisomerase IB [Sneathiella sp.]|uniref:DNA topoisomerase IB n=1 Tax=Sneathiella sp. TaxID=1964365 RepID=UPI002FE08E34